MQFPNLPYYIDGDVKHSESIAIMRSICRKYKPEYLGRNEVEASKADALTASLMDQFFQKWFGPNLWVENWKENKEQGVTDAKALLDAITTIKGDNKFMFGNEPTYGDFMIAGIPATMMQWDASVLEGYGEV